jgi:hypothetical protein
VRGRGGPLLFVCGSRELFVSENVWRFFFKGYELGDSVRVFTFNFIPVLLMTMGLF